MAFKQIMIPKLEKWDNTPKIYYLKLQEYSLQVIIMLLRLLKIFIEQNPEIRKARQCTKSMPDFIEDVRKYVFSR